LHRQFRMVIDAPWYRSLFPAMRAERDSGTELVTTRGGSRYATSVGGTLTGRGADLIIVDDPLKAEELDAAKDLPAFPVRVQDIAPAAAVLPLGPDIGQNRERTRASAEP